MIGKRIDEHVARTSIKGYHALGLSAAWQIGYIGDTADVERSSALGLAGEHSPVEVWNEGRALAPGSHVRRSEVRYDTATRPSRYDGGRAYLNRPDG